MGYTTNFIGHFNLDTPLTEAQATYLNQFSETRRMRRYAKLAEALPDPMRLAVGLPIGDEGGYFVGANGCAGQDKDASVREYNEPPTGQPGLWCQWVVNLDSRNKIGWNESEKFYNYVEWLKYIIHHFLVPWGRALNGEMTWEGEDNNDRGKIIIVNNIVATKTPEDKW